jgi:hypothetical protein
MERPRAPETPDVPRPPEPDAEQPQRDAVEDKAHVQVELMDNAVEDGAQQQAGGEFPVYTERAVTDAIGQKPG